MGAWVGRAVKGGIGVSQRLHKMYQREVNTFEFSLHHCFGLFIIYTFGDESLANAAV
jgi:hypothetical protein